MSKEPESTDAEKSSVENRDVSFRTRSVLKLIGSGEYVTDPRPRLALLLEATTGTPEKLVVK